MVILMKILLKTRYAPDFECDQDGNTDCFYHQVNKVVAKINKTKQKQKKQTNTDFFYHQVPKTKV